MTGIIRILVIFCVKEAETCTPLSFLHIDHICSGRFAYYSALSILFDFSAIFLRVGSSAFAI